MDEKSILIVDDDRDTRTIIRTIVNNQGFKPLEAASGIEALELLKSHIPSLILLDIMMPEMSGYDVVTRLKMSPETQSLPIIMLTAKAEDDDILSGYNDFSVDYYITKPFTSKVLINGINLVLANYE